MWLSHWQTILSRCAENYCVIVQQTVSSGMHAVITGLRVATDTLWPVPRSYSTTQTERLNVYGRMYATVRMGYRSERPPYLMS